MTSIGSETSAIRLRRSKIADIGFWITKNGWTEPPNSSIPEMALVALKASLKKNHLQMTSHGSETCSIDSKRSKRPKIHPNFHPEWFSLAKDMPITNSLLFSPKNSTKLGIAGVSFTKNSNMPKKSGLRSKNAPALHLNTYWSYVITYNVTVWNGPALLHQTARANGYKVWSYVIYHRTGC